MTTFSRGLAMKSRSGRPAMPGDFSLSNDGSRAALTKFAPYANTVPNGVDTSVFHQLRDYALALAKAHADYEAACSKPKSRA